MSRLPLYPESHFVNRIGWLRAAVLGANDGILSTASLIVGVAAAAATQNDVLIAGVAGLVAGAMSMAAGEYVSVSSQSDTEQADLARERQELNENPGFELDELADIYVKRGVDRDLSRQVAQQLMAKDALTAHARDELGISEITTPRPRASRADIGAVVLCGRGHAVADGCGVARCCACPDRGRCVVGLSRFSRSDRRESRRCQRSARQRPRDILGRVGDGSHRQHRETLRHHCLKIGTAEGTNLPRQNRRKLYVRHRT